jgi:site-specific DNA recombinase
MVKYFLYSRKSSEEEDRQMLSIQAQLNEVRHYARKESFEISKEFTESKTAKKPGREVFNRMLQEIEEAYSLGQEIGIISWNPDRLARNSVDGGKIIYLIDQGIIKDLKFPTFHFDQSPHGKFNLSIAFGQAKLFIDCLRINTQRGIREKLRLGQYPAKAPWGYYNHPKTRTIEPHPENFEKVKSILELYANGNSSLTDIRDIMHHHGFRDRNGNKLKLDNARRLLSNHFYYGCFIFKGELHQGSHQPMISKTLWDKIQKILKSKSRTISKPSEDFIYRGLAKCAECGSSITTEEHTKKSGLRFKYYRCTKRKKNTDCDQPYVREEALIKQVEEQVSALALSDDWSDVMLQSFELMRESERQSSLNEARELGVQLKAVQNKLDKLLDLHLDGSIEAEEYKSKKSELLNQKLKIQEEISQINETGSNWFEPAKTFIKQSNQAYKDLKNSNHKALKNFIEIISSNSTIHNRELKLKLSEPWSYFNEHQSLCWMNSSTQDALNLLKSENVIGVGGHKKIPHEVRQPIGESESKWGR